jgi:hypothetical protein
VCERALGGRELGVRRVATVAVPTRLVHSSATTVKGSNQEDHAEGVPRSSAVDGRVIVQWGLGKSRL